MRPFDNNYDILTIFCHKGSAKYRIGGEME